MKVDSEITRYRILGDVAAERRRQIFGERMIEPADGELSAFDWHATIDDYNSMARRMRCMGRLSDARRRYVQIAALAVAAVEAIDRLDFEP